MTLNTYCDGCRKATGNGGYGYLIENTHFTTFAGSYLEGVTNNVAELEAAIELCRLLVDDFLLGDYYIIHCDSQYFVRGLNEWLDVWKRQNFTKMGGPKGVTIANLEQWKQLLKYKELLHLKAKWLRGHSGNPGNEFVDRVANFCYDNQCEVKGFIPTGTKLSDVDLNDYKVLVININDVFGSYGSVN